MMESNVRGFLELGGFLLGTWALLERFNGWAAFDVGEPVVSAPRPAMPWLAGGLLLACGAATAFVFQVQGFWYAALWFNGLPRYQLLGVLLGGLVLCLGCMKKAESAEGDTSALSSHAAPRASVPWLYDKSSAEVLRQYKLEQPQLELAPVDERWPGAA